MDSTMGSPQVDSRSATLKLVSCSHRRKPRKDIPYFASHSEGFQPDASASPLKCVLVMNGWFKYCGSVTTVVITSGETVRKYPGRVREMIAACTAGWTAYLNDPAPANAYMETLNKDMDPATFTAAADAQKPLIKTEQTDTGGLGMMTVGRWDQLSRQLVELKVIDKEIPAKDCFVSLDQLK